MRRLQAVWCSTPDLHYDRSVFCMTIADVIVVASDAAFRHSLVFVLESGDFQVLPFGTLDAALASTRHYGECAVIDEEVITDREHAKKLIRTFARPVILLVDNTHTFPDVDMVRYLTKPFLGEPLLRAVYEAVADPDT